MCGLAKNSPYRFASPADAQGLEFVLGGQGNGAMLRIFESVSNGAFEIETELVDGDGARLPLRASARITDEAGLPVTVPRFDEYPPIFGAADPDF